MGTEEKRACVTRDGEVECARLNPPVTLGVTFPSGEAQEQLIQSLYQPAGLAPESLEYVEAHGTGTKVTAPSAPPL